ncbi:hypothetical protein SALBM311S_12801 [Streptomyces alboniger]
MPGACTVASPTSSSASRSSSIAQVRAGSPSALMAMQLARVPHDPLGTVGDHHQLGAPARVPRPVLPSADDQFGTGFPRHRTRRLDRVGPVRRRPLPDQPACSRAPARTTATWRGCSGSVAFSAAISSPVDVVHRRGRR